jgi:hypothetical protein
MEIVITIPVEVGAANSRDARAVMVRLRCVIVGASTGMTILEIGRRN